MKSNALIEEFLHSPNHEIIREVYRTHFKEIIIFIERYGRDLSLEDISKLRPNLSPLIDDNREFLIEVNRAISKGEIKLEHLISKN